MILEKIKIKNFKKFEGIKEIKFNEDINIFIGDNEAGKSTILSALDIVFSGSISKVDSLGLENLFNINVIKKFLETDRSYSNLPELHIEIFLKETGNPDLNGENYIESNNVACDGIKFSCVPNDKNSKEIVEILKNKDCAFPFEYYICGFYTFSGHPYNSYNKYVKHIFIDNSNIQNEYAIKEYTTSMYKSYTDNNIQSSNKNQYRLYKRKFEKEVLTQTNQKLSNIKFGLSNSNKLKLENNLAVYENDIDISNKGTGKQTMVKTEFALKKQINNIDIILIEEPENHLSYSNVKRLIENIIKANEKQIFLTTHNNMICSRLNLRKMICMNSNVDDTLEFNKINKETAKFFIKSPNNNILNFVLSKKVILVEGAAEYILMEKFFEIQEKTSIDQANVNIISVNGLSFERYLDIAQILKIKVAVITDNDKNYTEKIQNKYMGYQNTDNIRIFADKNIENYTFEVSLYKNNVKYLIDNKITNSIEIQKFMLNNKAENAYRILENLEVKNDNFVIPQYIREAIEWIKS